MRAIAGIVRFDRLPVARGEFDAVMARMSMGGLDRTHAVAAGPAAFGHMATFLAPEDRFEAQPYLTRNGQLLLAADALLDNRAELARDLGLPPGEAAALPDSALVLRAFERWGEACPGRLEGKFAFAAWDAAQQRLFCAVDSFSMRPLYYHRSGPVLAFASTLRGLFAVPGIPRRLNDGVLADFMLTQPADPGETLYAGVGVVPAAHHLRAGAAGTAVGRYWSPDLAKEIRFGATGDYVRAFREHFDRAVEAGLRTEKNVAIMVSGGLDSAAATAVAGEMLQRRGKRLQAIHLLPQEGTGDPRRTRLRDPDESPWVRMMEREAPHIDFHYLPRRTGKLSLSLWDEQFERDLTPLRAIVTEPTGDAEPGLQELGLERTLFGLGGNYVVSLECRGNAYLPQLMVRLQWGRLMRELRGARDVYGIRRKALVRSELLAPLLAPFRRPHDPRLLLLPCLNPDFVRKGDIAGRIARSHPRFWDAKDFDCRRQRAWIMTDLMPQHRGVTGSVIGPHSTGESHLPFFDRRLNEFCLAVPLEQQIDRGWDRLLLRRAMKGLLPDQVAWRTTRGFPSVGLWEAAGQLQRALPAALEEMRKSPLVGAYLDLDEFERQFSAPLAGPAPWLAAKRLNDLFCTAWFLRWLGRSS